MIQKKIHITWKTERIFESKCFMVEHGLKKLISLNPDWEVEFSDDEDIDRYLKENISIGDYEAIRDRGIVEKCDLWRLVKIYNEGGLYIDLDRFVNIPLSDIIGEGIRWVLPTYRDVDFSHDIMLCAAGNPIFGNAAGLNMERRRMGYRAIYLLGPQTWKHSVSYGLVGDIVESNPGVEMMGRLREVIAGMSFCKTYREEPWRDTLFFRGGAEYEGVDYELEKRRMYEEFGMDHWTGAYSKT